MKKEMGVLHIFLVLQFINTLDQANNGLQWNPVKSRELWLELQVVIQ